MTEANLEDVLFCIIFGEKAGEENMLKFEWKKVFFPAEKAGSRFLIMIAVPDCHLCSDDQQSGIRG